MSNSRRIVIEFLGQDKSLGSTADSTESRMSKLGSRMKKVGLVAAGAFAVGTVVAGKALVDMTKAAIDDEHAQQMLANTLRKAAGATKEQVDYVEEWISAQGRAKGVADDQLRPALQRLAEATGNVDAATELSTLAMDISAATGKDLESVSKALGRAYNGNVAALGKYGIKTKDAKGETMEFYDAVRVASATFEGAASKSANTLSGRIGRLQLAFDEAKEALGAKFLPVVERLVVWFQDKVMPAAMRLSRQFRRELGPAIARVSEFITSKAVPAAQQFIRWYMDNVVPGIRRALIPVLEAARDFFERLRKKVQENEPELRQLGRALREVGEFIYRKVVPALGEMVGFMIRRLGPAIGNAIDSISNMVRWFNTVKDAINSVINAVGSLISKLGNIKMPNLNLPNIPGLRVAVNPVMGSLPNFRGGVSVGGSALSGGSALAMSAGGTVVNINGPVYGDPRAFAKFIVRELRAEKRLTGQALGLA